MKSNRLGSKEQILEQLIIIGVFGLVIYFITTFSTSLFTPNLSTIRKRNLSAKFGLIYIVAISAFSVYNIHTAIMHELNKFIFIIMGLGMTASGNLMHSIPFKHPLGLRLSWVRESESNWRKTHRVASKVYFFTGLLLVAGTLLMPDNRLEYVWLPCVMIPTVILIVYSYWWA